MEVSIVQERPTQSKFLGFFRENAPRLREESHLFGDLLIIERIQFPELKTRSGLIVPDSKKVMVGGLTTETPVFFRVLAVGNGYYNETTGKSEPVECEPGDVILTANASVKIYSSFPLMQLTDSDYLGLTRYGDVQWHWKGEDKFIQFLHDFNKTVSGTS